MILRLSLFNSLIRGLNMTLAFFLGIHFASIGLSGTEIGIIFAIYSITNLISILPSGIFNDNTHSKTLILIALILSGARLIGYSQTTTLIPLAILSFFGGIGTALYKTSSESLFHKLTEKKDVSKKIAIFQGILYTGMAISMALGGYLLDINYTFNNLFIAIGIIFIIAGIAAQFILPENDTIEVELLEYQKDIWQKKVIALLVIVLVFSLHIGAEVTSYGLFLKNYLYLTSLQTGLYMGIAVFFMGGAVILINKYLKQITTKGVFLGGLLISGIFHTAMVVQNPALSLLFRTLHEIGDAAVFFSLYYVINQFFDLKRVGGLNSISLLTLNIGIAIGSLFFGPIGEAYGYNYAMAGGGLAILLSFIIALPYMQIITAKK